MRTRGGRFRPRVPSAAGSTAPLDDELAENIVGKENLLDFVHVVGDIRLIPPHTASGRSLRGSNSFDLDRALMVIQIVDIHGVPVLEPKRHPPVP